MPNERRIAYFSMEIGLDARIPTYSGGLGVLAGDTIRSASDLAVPMVAITLLHRKGYFYQRLDHTGWQTEEPVEWSVDDFLAEEAPRASVTVEGRTVSLRAWRLDVTGIMGSVVPVYFLDSDLPENSDWDRTLTHHLYGGDNHYRLCQEVILGVGGVRMLRALGYTDIQRYHMNEGHASLCTLELLNEQLVATSKTSIGHEDIDAVRSQCVFTTHTAVPAGHDQFPMDLVERVLGKHEAFEMREVFCCGDVLNMTYLALNLSHYVNGVAKKHGEISRHMFAPYMVDSITNGVHAATWISDAFQDLFDQHITGWREDNFSLRYALGIPDDEIWNAHLAAKRDLIDYVNRESNSGMDIDYLTLGFARRAASYKRADLLFHDPDRLIAISRNIGPIQIVYAGKAHPSDHAGKELIQRVIHAQSSLGEAIRIAYLPNYDMTLGRLITAGVDVWLNTPRPPMEASGTSGMKAALNGVPSLSILDGWWIEGCIEGVTGWAIGDVGQRSKDMNNDDGKDAALLYDKIEGVIAPLFYNNPAGFINIMSHCIGINGSFFNTQRMVQQYMLKAYCG
jgi:starch phosphorylase